MGEQIFVMIGVNVSQQVLLPRAFYLLTYPADMRLVPLGVRGSFLVIQNSTELLIHYLTITGVKMIKVGKVN